MRWNCPHCHTELYSNALSNPDSISELIYGRCSSCDSFAAIDFTTGKAIKIEPKAKAEPKPAPPALILADEPHVIQAQLIQGPVSTRRALAQHQETLIQAAALPRRRGSAALVGLATAALAIGSAVALGEYIYTATQAEPPRLARATAAAQKMAPPPVVVTPPEVIAAQPIVQPTLAALPISDSIHAAAMAPTRIEDEPIPTIATGLTARARKGARSIEMRAGPGDDFALAGLADLQGNYKVLEWKNRWFRISLGESGKTAWVHHDGIELASIDKKGMKSHDEH